MKIIALVASALICVVMSSCSKPEGIAYNFGTEDKYRTGEALLSAIAKNEDSTVMEMIKKGAPLNYRDQKDEWTPLVYAIYYENWDIAEFLIKAGVNVNLTDNANRTALMWCAMRGKLSLLKELIKHGADINAIDIAGRTALQYAIAYDNGNVTLYLTEISKIPRQELASYLKQKENAALKKTQQSKQPAKQLKKTDSTNKKVTKDVKKPQKTQVSKVPAKTSQPSKK
jgi:ankyrin repeat protein